MKAGQGYQISRMEILNGFLVKLGYAGSSRTKDGDLVENKTQMSWRKIHITSKINILNTYAFSYIYRKHDSVFSENNLLTQTKHFLWYLTSIARTYID